MMILVLMLLWLAAPAMGEAMPVVEDELLPIESIEDEDSVRTAQQVLIDMGLLNGAADGKLGPVTETALKTWQAKAGLPETGVLDSATLAALMKASPVSLEAVQQRLIELGYLRGEADGLWGSRSEAAMKLFERLQGLEEDGIVDESDSARLFSDNVTALPAALEPGDKGEAVQALQQKLTALGFMTAEADGAYGKNTVAAVKAVQQHLIEQGLAQPYDLEASGSATAITLWLLYGEDYSSFVRELNPGDVDPEVERVERRLNQLGYMDMPADDTLDDYALEALALFQKDAALTVEGTVNKAAVDALFSEDAPTTDHPAPHAIAAGDSGIYVRELEEALALGGMTIKLPNGKYDADVVSAVGRVASYLKSLDDPNASLFADAEHMSVEAQTLLRDEYLGYHSGVGGNSTSEAEVLRVQRRLHMLCYLSKDGVDGKFGDKSVAALKAFQTANDLRDTGVADIVTQNLLFSTSAEVNPLPYRVEVSLADQRVTVYKRTDAGKYERVRAFVCSTGLHNSTPRGIFLDGFPVNRWHYFSKFHCWAQYSYDIEGDIMFHSVIYSSNNEHSLRDSSVYNLGSPASHGCIRLEVKNAKWLFENCPKGSLAIIIS